MLHTLVSLHFIVVILSSRGGCLCVHLGNASERKQRGNCATNSGRWSWRKHLTNPLQMGLLWSSQMGSSEEMAGIGRVDGCGI